MEIRIKAIVSGFVQGVGYSYFCYRKAEEYNIKGFAKNRSDGSVEVEAEGDRNLIRDFIKDLKIGPLNAVVKSVQAEELPYENKFSEFKMY
jgi:acylphosphatase